MLEAAYNLSVNDQEAVQSIASIATRVTPRGPVAVGYFNTDAQLDLHSMHFERADERYVRNLLAWQQAIPIAVRRNLLSLAPAVFNHQSGVFKLLPDQLQAEARSVISLCIMANTGDGGGLHIVFGNQAMAEWPPARMYPLRAIAQHLAVAWRLRTALTVANMPPAVGAESTTARDVLRRVVLAREPARAGWRSAGDRELWPALVAGQWSLLDAFTANGARYIVAYENPAGATEIRALTQRERIVLEHVLAGRSGKWIALELELSEPTVARALRAALRRIGVADTAALAGVQAARWEPLEGVSAWTALVMTCLRPTMLSLGNLRHAERDIVAGILSGKRLAEIARERGTSLRTVANQAISIYQKLGVSSRRELLAQLA